MNGNCHFLFGATIGAMAALNLSAIAGVLPNITATQETATLMVMGGIFGGIFPDIDNSGSYMGKLSEPVSTAIGVINKKFGRTGSNHRCILHSPVLYLLLLVWSYFCFAPLIGFFIGCLSHVFLDMFNPAGVPIFLYRPTLRIASVKSGSLGSIVLTWVLVFVTLGIGIACKAMFG